MSSLIKPCANSLRRGIAVYQGKDVAKLKNKGGKWKYCSEQDMLDVASKFVPYRSSE
jgi:DNA-3-methyladenine glycosylase II